MKTKKTLTIIISLVILAIIPASIALAQKATGRAGQKSAPKSRTAQGGDEALKAALEALLKLPVAERIERLRAFLEANPGSSLRTRATEQLVSAHAALGDERLGANDAAGGIELFKQAVALAPAGMSDKLYYEVISQLPANLFIRGQSAAALELARTIETLATTGATGDAKRLLALAAFYVNVEQGDEAARLAKAAITLAPDLAAAYQALGAAHRLALRLDEAAAEYARAVKLDPRSAPARHSLADLRRATGKPEEALMLYRELLAEDAKNTSARTGVVLALFDTGRREEAERELEATLTSEPRNLFLLAGAAYWYAAQGEMPRALALAEQAVKIEPRYTWGHVALARALVAGKLPFEAERSLRFARQFGRFPTLDYELAHALVAAGLYNEASEELARSFTIKDGELETQLAGRYPARAASFIKLLAPERRASIFQANAADTEANARVLKGLLALDTTPATRGVAGSASSGAGVDSVIAAVDDFTSGTDEMRAFRQLYAASRLLRRGGAPNRVLELMDAARLGVEAAIAAPAATVATTADELRDVRANAIATQGGMTNIPALPRNAISNLLRGRIEELTGLALLEQGKTVEAVAALRRAVSVLPERSLYWRAAQWRLGTALATGGNERDALAVYLKSYNPAAPDAARRAVIENLYLKVNGTLAGLDAQVGPAPSPVRGATSAAANAGRRSTTVSPSPAAPSSMPSIVESLPELPVTSPATTAQSKQRATPDATPAPISSNANAETNASTTAPVEEKQMREMRTGCALNLNANTLALNNSGGTGTVVARLEGGSSLAGISATTTHWSDIIILREPQDAADATALKFTVTSISKATGNFNVTFKSPCGTQELLVMVK